MGRCNKAERRLRVDHVLKLVMEGFRREDIFQIVNDPKAMKKIPGGVWDITIHSIDKYLVTVHELLKELSKYDAIEEVGRARARLDNLYNMAKTVKDKLAVIKELHEIEGLKETRIRVAGQVDTTSHITVEIVRPKAAGNGSGDGGEGKDNGGEE